MRVVFDEDEEEGVHYWHWEATGLNVLIECIKGISTVHTVSVNEEEFIFPNCDEAKAYARKVIEAYLEEIVVDLQRGDG